MIAWFLTSVRRQVMGFLSLVLLCALLDYFLTPTPTLRLRTAFVLQGLAAGAFTLFLLVSVHFLAAIMLKPYNKQLRVCLEKIYPKEFIPFIGAFFFSAFALEIFFRGYLFHPLLGSQFLPSRPWALFLIHICCLTPFNLLYHFSVRQRTPIAWLFVRGLEAVLLAYVYLQTRSLTAAISAHMIITVGEKPLTMYLLDQYAKHPIFARIRPRMPSSVISN